MEVILENLRNLRQKCGEEGTIKFKDVEICCTALADLGGGARPARAPPHLPGILVFDDILGHIV